jgi:hypothetical protein
LRDEYESSLQALDSGLQAQRERQNKLLLKRQEERRKKRMKELIDGGMSPEEAAKVNIVETFSCFSLYVEYIRLLRMS